MFGNMDMNNGENAFTVDLFDPESMQALWELVIDLNNRLSRIEAMLDGVIVYKQYVREQYDD